jgi:putative lipoic acid-binding regulatory protein
MSDLKLTFEDFEPLASTKVYEVVDNLLTFENTDDYTEMVEKFGQEHADAVVETIQRHTREQHYEHMVQVKYQEYLNNEFNID